MSDNGSSAARARAVLAPTGVLRIAINANNGLLVSRVEDGTPAGVAPEFGAHLAAVLGAPHEYVLYPAPGPLADASGDGVWDIGLVADEPARAETIAFTPAYAEIEAVYAVRADSALSRPGQVDAPGRVVMAPPKSAFGLWLQRRLASARFAPVETVDGGLAAVAEGRADAAAGLARAVKARLVTRSDLTAIEEPFMTVRQAVGVPRAALAALPWLSRAVTDAVASGRIADLIARHGADGLRVADLNS